MWISAILLEQGSEQGYKSIPENSETNSWGNLAVVWQPLIYYVFHKSFINETMPIEVWTSALKPDRSEWLTYNHRQPCLASLFWLIGRQLWSNIIWA